MEDAIREALRQLDPTNDDHWTADGAPRMDVVEDIVGNKSITRKDVVNAAPDFNRETAADPENLLMNEGDGEEPKEEDTEPAETDEESGEGETDEESGEGETPPEDEQAQSGDNAEDQPTVEPPEQPSQPEVEPMALSEAEWPMTEQDFVKFLQAVKSEDLEDLEKQLHDSLLAAQAEEERMREHSLQTKRALNYTRARIKTERPNTSNAAALREYIDSQNAARAARVAKRNQVLANISPKEIDPRSPLDASMARKTARGTKRPARALIK